MLNIFAKEIHPERILKLQNFQYAEKLLLTDVVPASSQKMGTLNVSSLGHFYCLYITGHYSTLALTAGVPPILDDGIDHTRGKLIDGSNQRSLFSDYIPFGLIFTPGRKKDTHSAAYITDAASNDLFYPQPFQYMFTVNSEIMFDVKNDSDTDNYYDITFHGIRFPVARRKTI